MDPASLPTPMQALSGNNLQTNNPQTWRQTDLQPQSQQVLGVTDGDIPALLSQPNNQTISLQGTRHDIINESIAPATSPTTSPSAAWWGVALVLIIIGLLMMFGFGRVGLYKRSTTE